MVQNGVVNEPARQAYARLRELEPKSIEPQVWLAIGREQDGDLKGAEAEYRTLLVGAEDPWKGLLETRLQEVTDKLGGGGATAAKPDQTTGAPNDPSAGGVAAMSPADRDKFIAQMVDGLAARLKTERQRPRGLDAARALLHGARPAAGRRDGARQRAGAIFGR